MSDPTAGCRSSDVDAAPSGGAAVNSSRLEKLLADQRQSWLRGQCACVEDYLRWTPDLSADAAAVVDLIVNEFRLRAELGENPTRRDFEIRFPEHADRIRARIESLGLTPCETNVTEQSTTDRPDGTATGQAAEALGSTEYDGISADSQPGDPTEQVEAHPHDAPTSLIEASEAIATSWPAGIRLVAGPRQPVPPLCKCCRMR